MMIDEIITGILRREGWDTYTDHPADRGGPTKWGITQKAWSEYVGYDATTEEIQGLIEQDARTFYEQIYVNSPKFDRLSLRLKPLLIDCGVNHGTRAASKWLQRAAGARQDGIVGGKTLAAVAAQNECTIYLRILSSRIKLFGWLVSKDPELRKATQAGYDLQAVFSHGWNNRAAHFVSELADQLAS